MALKFHHQLFFFFFFFISFTHCSSSGVDFKSWIEWNVKNHHKKITNSQPAVGLDDNLRKAEMNKISIIVNQNGNGNGDHFKTITEALKSIPPNNKRRYILNIKSGVYREKIKIPRNVPYVTFLGDLDNPPTITGNDSASSLGKEGIPLRTYDTATVAINSNYFVAINIKFENTATRQIGSDRGQAVALRISGTKASFYNCSFFGDQDTLYDHKGLHYFNNCFIQGSVDFVFGSGRSLYERCHLHSIATEKASLTAQKRTNASLESGFSFKEGRVTGSSSLVYLGRPWGDYSRVIFSYTFMDKIVIPEGWSDWGDKKRFSKVYYGEYKCEGPGANQTARVPWALKLTDEEAQPFIGSYYVEGDSWLINP
ncbi:hypothetical protein ACFE04_018223 [Oxalis oulophora]